MAVRTTVRVRSIHRVSIMLRAMAAMRCTPTQSLTTCTKTNKRSMSIVLASLNKSDLVHRLQERSRVDI